MSGGAGFLPSTVVTIPSHQDKAEIPIEDPEDDLPETPMESTSVVKSLRSTVLPILRHLADP